MWSLTWRILWSGFNIYLQLVKSVFLRNYLTFDTQTEHRFNLDVKQNGMTENVPDFWRSSMFKVCAILNGRLSNRESYAE